MPKTKYTFAKNTMSAQRAAEILGVSLNATEKEIKQAYHKLMLKWHPDRNPDNPEQAKRMSQLINEACAVMYEYARHRRPQNNINQNQNQNHQPNNNYTNNSTEIRRAWNKLQDAVHAYETAKVDYDVARDNQERAWKNYSDAQSDMYTVRYGTPEYNDKKARAEKMRDVYSRASEHSRQCYAKMLNAQNNIYSCKMEYVRLMHITHQRKSYQHAA